MRGLGLRLIATFVFVMLFVGFGHAQESAQEMHSRIDNGGPIARSAWLTDSELNAPRLAVKGKPECAVEVSSPGGHTIELEVNSVGELDGWMKVSQIIDKSTMLVNWTDRSTDALLWFEGFSTDGVTDGKMISVNESVTVSGTKQYKTAFGTNTVLIIKPIRFNERAKQRQEQERKARPRSKEALRLQEAVRQMENKVRGDSKATQLHEFYRTGTPDPSLLKAKTLKADTAKLAALKARLRVAIQQQNSVAVVKHSDVAVEYRTWTDSSGTHKTDAKFSGIIAGEVKLIKRDGTAIMVPLDDLSEEDKEWINNRGKTAEQPNVPAAANVSNEATAKPGPQSVASALPVVGHGTAKKASVSADAKRVVVVAVWEHHWKLGKKEQSRKLQLFSNGHAGSPDGDATWEKKGSTLTLRWEHGKYVDICTLSKDGRSYDGHSQQNRNHCWGKLLSGNPMLK